MTFIFKSILNCIQFLIASHLSALFEVLDPVQDSNKNLYSRFKIEKWRQTYTNPNRHPIKYQFLFPPLCLVVSYFYGLLVLEYNARGVIQLEQLGSSPYISMHQILPEKMWPKSDILLIGALIVTSTLYLPFIFFQSYHPGYRMFYQQELEILELNGKNFTKDVTDRIMNFRKKSRALLNVLVMGFVLFVLSYIYTMVQWHGVYRVNVVQLVYWFWLMPFWVFYMIFGKCNLKCGFSILH